MDTPLSRKLQEVLSSEKKAAIPVLLNEAHCCPYCVMRVLGVTVLAAYQVPPDLAMKTICSVGDVSQECGEKEAPGHCPGCGDSIGLCHDKEFCAELVRAVEECGYEHTTYILNVHQPISFDIRRHSLWIFAKEKFPFVVLLLNIRAHNNPPFF